MPKRRDWPRPAAVTLSKRPTLLYHSIATACLSTKILALEIILNAGLPVTVVTVVELLNPAQRIAKICHLHSITEVSYLITVMILDRSLTVSHYNRVVEHNPNGLSPEESCDCPLPIVVNTHPRRNASGSPRMLISGYLHYTGKIQLSERSRPK